MSDSTTISKPTSNAGGFEIFKTATAPTLDEEGHMTPAGMTPEIEKGIALTVEATTKDGGNIVKCLFSRPGFSLTYAWFKSGFPLPLHTHNADCLYYITAGTLQLGNETLGAGDGFFVGADKAYRYTPGPEGVEVLEFRHEEDFDIKFLAKSVGIWEKIAGVLADKQDVWPDEVPPSTRN
ncbi:cupin domain-containing protein [Ponticaulis profundi]|uniref:Cupin domain-containing protein n=1 Tax=Ponticaulis profundi TaxID=2665222 RepID=A0ABW1S4A8_9PROT